MDRKFIYTKGKIIEIQPSTIDPLTGKVIDQDITIELKNKKKIIFFEWSDNLFKKEDIGKEMQFALTLDATNDKLIKQLHEKKYSLTQEKNRTEIEGEIIKINSYEHQKYSIDIDCRECVINFLSNKELKIGDFIYMRGRLQNNNRIEIKT